MAKLGYVNYHKLFHRNMLALTTFNSTSKTFKACFKMGMFSCPNEEGFIQLAYFLMNIIYPGTQAFRSCWPILEKSHRRAFRAVIIDIMRGLNAEFGDIYLMSDVVPGRLMSPGGDRFVKIMWELSMLALGVQAKREAGDSECFFFHKPPVNVPQDLCKQGELIWRAHTRKNLTECEAKLAKFEEIMTIYKELKGSSMDRMLVREKKIREIGCILSKLAKDSNLGEDLETTILDLNIEDGVLEEKLKPKNSLMVNHMQHWEYVSSLADDTKSILEAAIKQDSDDHKLVLDASDCGTSSIAFKNPEWAQMEADVSVLQYLSGLHDKLKRLKSVKEENDLNELFKTWNSIGEQNKLLDSDMRKMELELEEQLSELTSRTDQNLVEEASESDYKDFLSLPGAASLTPKRSSSASYADASLNVSSSITPHQPATKSNYFSEKLESIVQDMSDDKERESLQKIVNPKINDPAIDNILERFHKIIENRKFRGTK